MAGVLRLAQTVWHELLLSAWFTLVTFATWWTTHEFGFSNNVARYAVAFSLFVLVGFHPVPTTEPDINPTFSLYHLLHAELSIFQFIIHVMGQIIGGAAGLMVLDLYLSSTWHEAAVPVGPQQLPDKTQFWDYFLHETVFSLIMILCSESLGRLFAAGAFPESLLLPLNGLCVMLVVGVSSADMNPVNYLSPLLKGDGWDTADASGFCIWCLGPAVAAGVASVIVTGLFPKENKQKSE